MSESDYEVGDIIVLVNQNVEVIECEKCDALMVNIDADEIVEGDLKLLKQADIRISNPDTKDKICLECEVDERPSFREKVRDYYKHDDDDDSHLFHGGSFGGGGGGFGGGWGGFGGGSFSGGGASRGF